MNNYIKNLKAFLAEQHPNYGYDDAHSLLELLYYSYTRENPIDSAVIRCQFRELNMILCQLTNEENDLLFNLAGDLCIEHERHAFLEGVHVGMRLITELNDLPG